MKKIINFLTNKKLLLIIASILALLFTLAFVISHFNGFVFYWYDYLWFAYSIALIFAVAYYIPDFVSFLIDIHQSNLEDIKEQAKQDEEELKGQYVD
jgi:Ca2+/H+ antiporter